LENEKKEIIKKSEKNIKELNNKISRKEIGALGISKVYSNAVRSKSKSKEKVKKVNASNLTELSRHKNSPYSSKIINSNGITNMSNQTANKKIKKTKKKETNNITISDRDTVKLSQTESEYYSSRANCLDNIKLVDFSRNDIDLLSPISNANYTNLNCKNNPY
jgi:hypothetical protein